MEVEGEDTPETTTRRDQPSRDQSLTHLLKDVGEGRAKASDELLPLVYEQLRAIARQRMAEERRDNTLQATALVHEAYVRMAGDEDISWQNRAHFFGAAARAMRRILIDHARNKGRTKRGGGQRRIPLNVVDLICEAHTDDVLAVGEAVDNLAQRDPRMAEIVHLRFYAGLTVEETASTLGLSDRTIRREWNLARAWLTRELEA